MLLFNANFERDSKIMVNIYIWVFFFSWMCHFHRFHFPSAFVKLSNSWKSLSKCNSHTNLCDQKHMAYLSLSVAANSVCVWQEPSQTWGTFFIISVALATAKLYYCNRRLIHHLNCLIWLWACAATRLHVPYVCIYWFPLQTMYAGDVCVCVCPCECFPHAVHA